MIRSEVGWRRGTGHAGNLFPAGITARFGLGFLKHPRTIDPIAGLSSSLDLHVKVLYLTINPNRASTTVPTEGWLRLLSPRGLRPVLASAKSEHFTSGPLSEASSTTVPLPHPSKGGRSDSSARSGLCARIVRRHHIEMIHCNEQDTYPIGQYLARYAGCPSSWYSIHDEPGSSAVGIWRIRRPRASSLSAMGTWRPVAKEWWGLYRRPIGECCTTALISIITVPTRGRRVAGCSRTGQRSCPRRRLRRLRGENKLNTCSRRRRDSMYPG